ncbi:unnamed protein product [Lymnaea stagnalis]|uniref:Uncharacterized protein n=1 Tax=Lymnaea stagnalis TaxID=6523 RepID=A0AAV2H9U6_LYMST
MASETFRSMYKPKLKEENTTMSRRKSRGIERKQLRADEVNKRRHVSNDISIVEEDHNTEDGHDHAILAHSPHKKAESLADRLKKWREEKKKQREEAKNLKKPMFKVSSNVQGSINSDLFIRKEKVTPAGAMLKSAKPSSKESLKRDNVSAGKTESKRVTHSLKENPVKPIVQVSKPSSNRITRSNTKLASTTTKGAVKTVAETKKLSGATVGSQKDKTKEKPSGLYTKLTEAAKAKVNLGKPKEFLRAKVHVNVPTKGTKTKAKNGSPERDSPRLPKDKDVAPNRKLSECAAVCAGASHLETSSFENEQGLHLSDSNVSTPKHSTPRRIRISSNGLRSTSGKKYRKTPAARHSAPHQKKTPRRSSRNISAIHCTPKKPVDQLPEKDRTPLTTAEQDSQVKNSPTLTAPGHNKTSESLKRKVNRKDKENCLSEENAGQLIKSAAQCSSPESAGQDFSVVITRLGSTDAPVMGDKGLEKNGHDSMNIRSSQRRKSKTMSNVQNHKTCDTTPKDSKSEILSNSVSKKNQQQEFTFAGENDENVEVQIPQKRLESSVTALIDNGSEEEMTSPAKRRKQSVAQEKRYLDDETLSNDGIGLDKQVNFDVDLKSAKVDKKYHTRKSLRRGALAASTGNSSTTESESENIQFSPRASFGSRGSKGRRSGRKSSRSVVVSVSDEGTTDANGKNIIEEFHPNVEYHDVSNSFSPNRSGRKIKSRKSVMLKVSDEVTSMTVSGPQVDVVYHVKKPALSDGSSRPLQELAVEKMDGEVSFIEVVSKNCFILKVPLDETTSESSFKKQQPASIDNIETTQAFIPSQSFSERTLSYLDTPPKHSLPIDSSTALSTISSPVTPRVLRSRGLSIGTPSTFKTPCQPVSAIKAKSGRRKTDSVKIKSPEEMLLFNNNILPVIHFKLTTRRKCIYHFIITEF